MDKFPSKMDHLRQLIALLPLLVCAEARNTSNEHDVNPLKPSMAVVLVVLSIMFSLTFLILAYAKFCHGTGSGPSDLLQNPNGSVGTRARFSGVDKTTIESLPFFRFSSLRGSKEGLECAVCLSRFEDTELLRLLPKCRHAFHISCIDTWLENHSSCPLCRHKLDAGDIKSSRHSSSSWEEPSLEFFIQREQSQSQGRSSRFNLANTLHKLTRGRRPDAPLAQEFKNHSNGTRILHHVKHRIIVSDVIHNSRWSDVNSSDLMSLNASLLNLPTTSGRFNDEAAAREQILKIKEDLERKRLFESKIAAAETSSMLSRSADPAQKRSMSEITNVSRFTDTNSSSSRISGFSTSLNSDKDEKVRRLWLPIARRTIQWFSGQETSSNDAQPKPDV
ncbi:E3 ubiquitin-protein ligase ATL42-like [Salvia miltiorrhiza]|uniref:E3 ubiquitin-protein ligase ATL42-like n=1 Tax=Salvia miltiorrhiza TaxID=226208 RepID=UPI0025AD0E70|nr:E3 ubiquitin-protein ligase ATL42-like [Salvia miltiorrhiza]